MATKKKTEPKTEAEKRNLQIALDLQALYRTSPIDAREKILAAFREKKGNAVHAAEVLGIGHRTLLRYMDQDPGLAAGIDKIRNNARDARKAEAT